MFQDKIAEVCTHIRRATGPCNWNVQTCQRIMIANHVNNLIVNILGMPIIRRRTLRIYINIPKLVVYARWFT